MESENGGSKSKVILVLILLVALVGFSAVGYFAFFTKETRNRLSRTMQNYTGTDGVLDIYAGDKLVMRFIHIDKLTTGTGTTDGEPRPYRYGYGVRDINFNYEADPEEGGEAYFEISDYGTSYVFYQHRGNND